jgi:uncharacterized membrane protein YfcA
MTQLLSFLDWHILWLVVVAFLAGLLNAVAGGGSFLLFPAMLGMGLPPIQANATNTVALWPGQLTSVAAYREDIRRNPRLALFLAFAGLIGGSVGAFVLLHTPPRTFLHMVPWLLLIAAGIFALSGPVLRWLRRRSGVTTHAARPRHTLLLCLCTIVVCGYIGYFGAGAGFLLITLFSLFGLQDLNQINAFKVAATTPANGIAAVIFAFSHQIAWRYCLLAMVSCAIGGYASARLARRVPQPVLRALVVLIGLSMAAWFFWRNS